LKASGPKKVAHPISNPPAKKSGGPVLKKDITANIRKDPILTLNTKVSNVKVSATPSVTGDGMGKPKESTIPRITKPIAKKGIHKLT
jgi:hypothetical protein